jgi:H+/gluconate symporter-like permease
MVQQNSFNSDYSTLSDASIILLIGTMVGVVLVLSGFLSAKRELRHPYY